MSNAGFSRAVPDADYMEVPESVEVFSWSPEPPETVDARSTQVHLQFGSPPGFVVVIRFKRAASLDKLIAALQFHRRDVWGEP